MLNSELETNTGNVRPPRLVIIESIRRDIEKARLKNSRRISYHGWRKRESSSLAYVSSQANDLDFWGQARQEGPARGFFLLEIRALINIARYIFSRRLVPGWPAKACKRIPRIAQGNRRMGIDCIPWVDTFSISDSPVGR